MKPLTAKELLQNYLDDLSYQLNADGVDTVSNINHCSNGTPYFECRAEADAYITELESVIEGMNIKSDSLSGQLDAMETKIGELCMSIKYDLLIGQIDAMETAIHDAQTKHPEHPFFSNELKGIKQLLETIRDEDGNCNLNPWENESDDAINEVNPLDK